MFGWLYGPQNYDTGTTKYQLATDGNQSPINVGGKQTAMGSNVMNTGKARPRRGDVQRRLHHRTTAIRAASATSGRCFK